MINPFNPVESFKQAIREWFSEIATEAASSAFEFLGTYVIAITDLDKIPSIRTLIEWSQMGAGILVMIFLMKRIIDALKGEALNEGEANFAEIVGSAAISMALIFATPYLIEKFMLTINNAVVKSITDLGIDVTLGNQVIGMFAPDGELALASLHIILMILIWAVAFLIFSIAGAIRYVDLAVVMIMGPLAATAYTNRSEVYRTYWVEAVAVIFTQCIHVLLAYFMIQWASQGTLLGIVGSIAGAVVAIRGPKTLRQFLYTSGAGGAVTGAGRFAFYKMMMRNVGR